MTFPVSFLHWYLLPLLAVPAALLVWQWRRRGEIALPLDHGRPGGGGWYPLVNLAESIPALLLAVAITILAGPQERGEPKDERQLTNIEFCVDVSGSMTAKFGDGSRYDAAMHSVDEFLTYRKGDAFGLTFFGDNVIHWVPLTTDVSAIRCAPPFMRPENAPDYMGGTLIAKALRACKNVLAQRQDGDRMILMVTDGDSADLNGSATPELIAELKKENVTVFAIIIGQPQIQDEMIEITHSTGGEAFEAGDPSALSAVFKRIDGMKQAKMKKTIAETSDWFAPLCWLGLGLGGAGLLAGFGLRATPW